MFLRLVCVCVPSEYMMNRWSTVYIHFWGSRWLRGFFSVY